MNATTQRPSHRALRTTMEGQQMKIHIEADRCVASGQCVMLAPAVFDQDDDGIAVLLAQPGPDDIPGVRESIRVCPARALSESPEQS
ncbi:ferredoxin [Streptomyces sp. NPDC059629]|uniref:ferredoxin n=1 Tax=Streptomyces sp. NPDC059629 TaxID=3346889 RepID=UPI00369973F2